MFSNALQEFVLNKEPSCRETLYLAVEHAGIPKGADFVPLFRWNLGKTNITNAFIVNLSVRKAYTRDLAGHFDNAFLNTVCKYYGSSSLAGWCVSTISLTKSVQLFL